MTTKTNEALSVLEQVCREDPDYLWTWQSNIALAAVDEGIDRKVANRAAARFLYSLFRVDVTQHPNYIDLMTEKPIDAYEHLCNRLHARQQHPDFEYVDITIDGMIHLTIVKNGNPSEFMDVLVGDYGYITKDFQLDRDPKWLYHFKPLNGWLLKDDVSVSWEHCGSISISLRKKQN